MVEIAMRSYWNEGPTEVSLNGLCQRAGVSKPSVYREFGNEDGLTHAALENYGHCVLAKVLEILAGEDIFAGKIRKIAYLAAEDGAHESGCLFVKMRTAKNQMGEKTQILIAAMASMAVDAYANLLIEGRETGEWPGNIPVKLGAAYLHAQIGLALDQRARGEDPRVVLALALCVLGLTDAQSEIA
ncbi:TetR/AcrR family transcriptional regulator [Planktotalea arctica]|uniref:TetR/AcrR family transcriptional regulator n=1 Tax=Planktotalea arctica TaxID=1481893 RepID=UPI00111C26B6|nr:TetR/AcrR family transcriptional regulator [Planktotalea arctica]